MTVTPPVLSVVGPVCNEELSLAEFHARLLQTMRELGEPFEIIYVDDGSKDRSLEILRRLREEAGEVKIISFSRNFGHQMAITAGLDHALGQACVVMDTDGQDPPEVIPELVKSWRQGHDVVYAVRSRRKGEGIIKLLTATLFYRIMRRITQVDMPLDAGDFRLLDRKVVSVMRGLRETHRFMRGLTSWVGFKQARVAYERQARLAGETHFTFWRMLRFALDGITSFSHQPLRWVTWSGLASFILSLIMGVWVIGVRLFNARAVQGWASLMVIILLLGGMQLMAMGVIGEYLARIFDEVKGRPLYVVREAIGALHSPRTGAILEQEPLQSQAHAQRQGDLRTPFA